MRRMARMLMKGAGGMERNEVGELRADMGNLVTKMELFPEMDIDDWEI